ncbi:hypothetical protein FZO89_06110 [Luteimonas viscosa]|uniref:FecR family protein n=1 Tax=Luteimonas viscosa TaxID=1132694 RepID=A0A5D4XMG1_9GAMM|nr:hypothetical protein [Luteimonas viscosa]TYT25857.1 hypothetical protein FZO89_06110 [Luteimonas viscosa]
MKPPFEHARDGEYLWDRSGEPDADVAGLERLLAPLRWQDSARRGAEVAVPVPRLRKRGSRRRGAYAVAAALALAAAGLYGWHAHRMAWPEARAWQVAGLEGHVRIDGAMVASLDALPPRALLETGDATVRLRAARIGEVVVGPRSRFRLVETRSGRHRTQLQQGTLWARVWAPPGAFGVSTPAGDVFDLGCEFVLRADGGGRGSLTVRSGWVQVDSRWREVLVPQGTRVDFGEGGEPGIPYDLGASDGFLSALRTLDAQGRDADPGGVAMRALLAESRAQDAISLVALLHAYPALAEGPLYERAQAIMPADARVTRAALRERGAHALSPWWDALPYPRIKRWWMQWPDAFAARDDARILLREDRR